MVRCNHGLWHSWSDFCRTRTYDGERTERGPLYSEAISCLLWLAATTTPDIANTVRTVASYSHGPSERHWQAVLKIIGYLNGTRDMIIVFFRGSGLDPSVYADPDFASKAMDRRSVSAAVVFIGDTDVVSCPQRCTTLSTSESGMLPWLREPSRACTSRQSCIYPTAVE